MTVKMHCEWDGCQQETDPEFPTNWWVLTRNAHIESYGEAAEHHFCSAVHSVAWLIKYQKVNTDFLGAVIHEDN